MDEKCPKMRGDVVEKRGHEYSLLQYAVKACLQLVQSATQVYLSIFKG
jgi:hypothetical protein